MHSLPLIETDPDVQCAAWRGILSARQARQALDCDDSTPLAKVFKPLLCPLGARSALVFAQLGQSLDGRIATVTGHSRDVNGRSALEHLHRLRAVADAVVVGVGTAIADDPRLNVRLVRGRSPTRVVIDPNGRLPRHAQCIRDDGVDRIIIRDRTAAAAESEYPGGTELVTIERNGSGIAAADIVGALVARGLQRILIEGGANTISRFLAAGLVHRLHIMAAPMIIGSGVSALQLPEIHNLAAALRPQVDAYALDSGDVLFDCAFESGRRAS